MNIEWVFHDVTPVGCPDRAERAIVGDDFERFSENSGPFVVGEQLC